METKKQQSAMLPTAGLFFAILGMILSGILICKHVFPGLCGASMGCEIDGVDGCARLGADPRSKLFGLIPLAIPGFFYYGYVAYLFYRLRDLSPSMEGTRRLGFTQLLIAVVAFGVIMDIVLAYTNFFVLDTPCLLCAYTYLATLGIAISAFFYYNANGREGSNEAGTGPLKDALVSSLPGAGASAALTAVLLGLFYLTGQIAGSSQPQQAHSSHSHSHKDDSVFVGVGLIDTANVDEVIADLQTRPEANFKTAGLVNVVGPESAYIEIHEFADVLCPHCLHASHLLKQARERWPGRIRVYYRHFPLDSTCNPMVGRPRPGGISCNGAMASLCAPRQDLFPEMYHRVFELQELQRYPTPEALEEITISLGGDWSKMASCMGSDRTMQLLQRDIRDASSIGLNSTPTVVVNGRVLDPGTPPKGYFFHTLDALVYQKEGQIAFDEFEKRKK